MRSITVSLPFPPSMNRLWRSGRGRVYRSKEYLLWITSADAIFLQQKRSLNPKTLPGKFAIVLNLWSGDGRKRKDADNRMKAVLDFCTRVRLIVDDQYCEDGRFRWVSKEEAGPTGCKITLTDLEAD